MSQKAGCDMKIEPKLDDNYEIYPKSGPKLKIAQEMPNTNNDETKPKTAQDMPKGQQNETTLKIELCALNLSFKN